MQRRNPGPVPQLRLRPPAIELDVEKHPNGRIKRLTIRVGVSGCLVPILILARAFGLDLQALLRLFSPLIGR
jgi:hypothetical protein